MPASRISSISSLILHSVRQSSSPSSLCSPLLRCRCHLLDIACPYVALLCQACTKRLRIGGLWQSTVLQVLDQAGGTLRSLANDDETRRDRTTYVIPWNIQDRRMASQLDMDWGRRPPTGHFVRVSSIFCNAHADSIPSVMGIFPIVMNVLQFWLIDSIVKASAGVVLEGDVEQQLGQDHEPLFDAPSDDDDDDDDRYRRTLSAEGQRLHKPSSSSFDSGFASQHLSQSTGITTPPDIESKSIESSKNRSPPTDQHAYPPSLSGSLKSNSSTSSKTRPLSKASSLRTKRPTEATVAGSSQHRPTVPETRPEEHSQPTDEWAVSWDDEEDDGWADGTHTKGQGGSQPLPRSRRLS